MSGSSKDLGGPLAALVEDARRGLVERFGISPQWIAAAPGRVNVIGEHTDYNEGFVLPMAIDKHVVLAAGPISAGGGEPVTAAELWSQSLGEAVRLPVQGSPKGSVPHWASYLQGVLAGFLARDVAVPPFRAVIVSDIPLGAGLSSSAALEVAMATLLEGITDTALPPRDKARIARQAEHDYAGVPCGIMDQLASVMGRETGPVLIDCRDESVTPVAMPQTTQDPPVLLICDSHVKHSLGDGAYARRRAECEEAARLLGARSLRDVSAAQISAAEAKLGPLLTKRARHVVTENERTVATAEALRQGDFERAGALMYASHRSLRDDYEVSVAEIDLLVELASKVGLAGGVYGSRITGGGFGGCTVSLVKAQDVETVARFLSDGYEQGTKRTLSTFVARPTAGAHLLDLTQGTR